MGQGQSSTPSPKAPKASADGAYEAPDRSQRAACWAARDEFFDCLNKHDILDSVKEESAAKEKCGRALEAFERDCAASWVGPFSEGVGGGCLQSRLQEQPWDRGEFC